MVLLSCNIFRLSQFCLKDMIFVITLTVIIKFCNSKVSILIIATIKVLFPRHFILFTFIVILLIIAVMFSFTVVCIFIFIHYYDWSLLGFRTWLSNLLVVRFEEGYGVVDDGVVSVSIRIIQLIYDDINLCCLHILGCWFGSLLRMLPFNVVSDVGS